MNAPVAATPARVPEAELLAALFRPMGARGVMARTGGFERVVEALQGLIGRYRPPGTEVLRFPPVMSRAALEGSGYLKSFANLAGCVACLGGAAPPAEGGWAEGVEPSDLVLTPASCYPVYPIAAAAGPLPAGGRIFDVGCDCFRREPSEELTRLQSFRMREYVMAGAPEAVAAFRGEWIRRASGLADSLGLPHRIEVAHDPFYGRGARFLAASQVERELKFELLVPVFPGRAAVACMSFNLHLAHFAETAGLSLADGGPAHSGCVAFGVDRLALALFAVHGLEPQAWPARARDQLGL